MMPTADGQQRPSIDGGSRKRSRGVAQGEHGSDEPAGAARQEARRGVSVVMLQTRVPRSMGTVRTRAGTRAAIGITPAPVARPPFRALTRRIFTPLDTPPAAAPRAHRAGDPSPDGTPYHVLFRQETHPGRRLPKPSAATDAGGRNSGGPQPHLVPLVEAEHPHFRRRGVLETAAQGPCVVCMDLATIGKRNKMQVQLLRMRDLLDTDERSCPIACEDFDKAEVDGLPEQCAAVSPTEFPEHCIAVLPCNHLFACVPLLYYMATESMRCPICRAGYARKRLRVSCLPEQLRSVVNDKLVRNAEQERIQAEENDRALAAHMEEAEGEAAFGSDSDPSLLLDVLQRAVDADADDSSEYDEDASESLRQVIVHIRAVMSRRRRRRPRLPLEAGASVVEPLPRDPPRQGPIVISDDDGGGA